MLDCDCIEGLQGMDESKRFTVLLDDTEPTRSIRRVRWLVDSGGDLSLDHRADFVVDPGRNGDILLHPGRVRNDGEIDGGGSTRA